MITKDQRGNTEKVKVNKVEMEEVEKFKYLGVMMSEDEVMGKNKITRGIENMGALYGRVVIQTVVQGSEM